MLAIIPIYCHSHTTLQFRSPLFVTIWHIMRSMRSHVTKTVSACFAVLRQLRSIRRSVPRSVLQTLVTSLVLTRLDYDNSTLAGIPLYLLKRLQSALNSAVRLLLNSSTYDHVAPLLRQRHWLMATPQLRSPLCTVGLSHIGMWVSVLMSCSYSVLLCFKFGFFLCVNTSYSYVDI